MAMKHYFVETYSTCVGSQMLCHVIIILAWFLIGRFGEVLSQLYFMIMDCSAFEDQLKTACFINTE